LPTRAVFPIEERQQTNSEGVNAAVERVHAKEETPLEGEA
jgi:hypothetical protein